MLPPGTKFTETVKHLHRFTSTLCRMARYGHNFCYISFESCILTRGNFAPKRWKLVLGEEGRVGQLESHILQ